MLAKSKTLFHARWNKKIGKFSCAHARKYDPARMRFRREKFFLRQPEFLRVTLVTLYYRVEFGFPSKNRRKQIAKISVFLRTVYTGFARKWSQRKKKHLAHEKNACVRLVCSGLNTVKSIGANSNRILAPVITIQVPTCIALLVSDWSNSLPFATHHVYYLNYL